MSVCICYIDYLSFLLRQNNVTPGELASLLNGKKGIEIAVWQIGPSGKQSCSVGSKTLCKAEREGARARRLLLISGVKLDISLRAENGNLCRNQRSRISGMLYGVKHFSLLAERPSWIANPLSFFSSSSRLFAKDI